MAYIAGLDHDHLDNGVFLTALARSISQQDHHQRRIIVHGDSEYTDRIMQTGVMREEAKIRSIKDLNHRLIALLADEGVSAIGLNGYQRKMVTRKDGQLSLDKTFFDPLPQVSLLVISTLIWDETSQQAEPVTLTRMMHFLSEALANPPMVAFSSNDKDEIIINDNAGKRRWSSLSKRFVEQNIPDEFCGFNQPLYLATARDFNNAISKEHFLLLHET